LRWGLEQPVIFAIGLPGAGAPLVTRYLLYRLELAHWPAAAGRHPHAPVVTTFLARRRSTRAPFGRDAEAFDEASLPRDSSRIWGRVFDAHRITRFEDLRPGDTEMLRGLVAVTQRVFGGTPFIDDCADHLLRIDALARVFPESLFLVVRRRTQDIAVSILRDRLAHDAGSPDGRGPRRDARTGLEEAVASEVRALQIALDADLGALPPQRRLYLDYEQFCQTPDASLGPLRRLLGAVAERGQPAGPLAAVHHVAADARERRLLALLADPDVRASAPGRERIERP
jgi:hypothetical protein